MADDLVPRLAQAIRESCIDPDLCEDDEEACFEQHLHPTWTVDGTIRHVEANVEHLAATVLAWLAGQGRLVPDLIAEVRQLRTENAELHRAAVLGATGPGRFRLANVAGVPRCPRCGNHADLHPLWAVCPPCAVAEGWEVT